MVLPMTSVLQLENFMSIHRMEVRKNSMLTHLVLFSLSLRSMHTYANLVIVGLVSISGRWVHDVVTLASPWGAFSFLIMLGM